MRFSSASKRSADDFSDKNCHEMMKNNCGKEPLPAYGLKLFLFTVLLKIIYNPGTITESYANSKCNIHTVKSEY